MKIIVVLLILGAVVFGFSRSQKKSFEEREAREKVASEAMYARQDQKYREQKQQFHDQAKARREESIRQNAPERDRIAREFPDAYRALGMKVGANLDECMVTSRDLHMTSYDKSGRQYTQVVLTAQCGPSLEESFSSN